MFSLGMAALRLAHGTRRRMTGGLLRVAIGARLKAWTEKDDVTGASVSGETTTGPTVDERRIERHRSQG